MEQEPKGGCVVQIWFEEPVKADAPKGATLPFVVVETAYGDFGEVLDAIASDEIIEGMRLWTWRGEEPGERIVMERYPTAFRGRAVMRVELPKWTFHERAT